jgi:hypothetical protein
VFCGVQLSRLQSLVPLAPSSVAVASWKAGCLKQGPVVEAGVDVGRVLHDLTWSRPRPLSTEAQDWWPGDIARSYRHRSANSPFEYVRNELLTLLSTTCARAALASSWPCLSPRTTLLWLSSPAPVPRINPQSVRSCRLRYMRTDTSVSVPLCPSLPLSAPLFKPHLGDGSHRPSVCFSGSNCYGPRYAPFASRSCLFECFCTTECCMFRPMLKGPERPVPRHVTLGSVQRHPFSPLVASAELGCILGTESLHPEYSHGMSRLTWTLLMLILNSKDMLLAS